MAPKIHCSPTATHSRWPKEIPGAELLALEQTGHELPRAVRDVVIPAILRHTAAAE